MRTMVTVLMAVTLGAAVPQRLSVSPPAPFVATRDQVALMETPKGQTILTCATLHDGFDAAVPQFRAIRDSIRPER